MSAGAERWTIRPWLPDDREPLVALHALISSHAAGEAHGFDWHGPPRSDDGSRSRTICAVRSGKLLAVGSVYESPVAPARWRLALHVHPAARRQGIGGALLGELRATAAQWDRRSLQAGVAADARAAVAFLDRQGFRPLMRTQLGTIQPDHISPLTWSHLDAAERRAAADRTAIVPWPALADVSLSSADLAALHVAIYGQTHAWSPLASAGAERAADLFLGDDLIPDGQFVAVRAGRPIGLSSVRRGEGPDSFDLGWTGVLDGVSPVMTDLTAALLGRSLRYAQERGSPLGVEVDAADTVLCSLMETLPVEWRSEWLNLEFVVPSGVA